MPSDKQNQVHPTDSNPIHQPSLLNKSTASFVYPVRSLLSGHIQPAPDHNSLAPFTPPHTSLSSDVVTGTTTALRDTISSKGTARADVQCWTKDVTDAVNAAEEKRKSAHMEASSPSLSSKQQTNQGESSSAHPPRPKSTSAPAGVEPSVSHKSRRRRRSKSPRHKNPSPNFRHYPAEDSPYFPRTFTSNLNATGTISTSVSSPPAPIETLMSGLGEPAELSSPIFPEPENDDSRHPAPLPAVVADALAVTSASLIPQEGIPQLPFNPSEYGIVHLPPLPLSPSPQSSDRGGASVYSRSSGPSHRTSTDPSSRYSGKLSSLKSATPSDGQRDSQEASESDSNRLSDSRSGSASQSGSISQYGSGSQSGSGGSTSASSEEPLVTFRFEHKQDENGNHVVIGREGKLTRCEDEPIRTPGAVQGFGVLIAVDELEETLVVRQVSENSTELLGLSPQYLFSLECFTDTLPDSQAGLLWDNIQFLSEPDLNSEEEEDSPHVFLLTGYGAPGTASSDDMYADTGRRSWTCWCAVHRPSISSGPSKSSGLIIMEFELERDTLNPLYPPNPTEINASGVVSPLSSGSTTSNHGSSTDSSENTLVSTDPGSGEYASSDSSVSDKGAAGHLQPKGTWNPHTPQSLAGLEGEDDWFPSAEDIFESTTSHAKPLLALERLRRMTRASTTSPNSQTSARSRRGGRRMGGGSGGVGMMDVFAVMAQINEQLGAAPDLEMFLKVVVGVIKDLTQFHRVLVYQFDEAWNGQVVAELVDWSQTRDLYKGLHFPAGDIPAQARELYTINKVRLLYDRSQSTARIVVRSKEDLETPLNMTHSYLRAMSPIHIKYLGNMGVRASMSISIMAFGTLWGLVTCHSYGLYGMRVSFPVRQMLRLLSQSISRNIERLSYAQRLHTRKLINTMASDNHPTGYIVSNADDLLGLFDADFGILVIGEGAKILGPNLHGQEILIMAEYLRLKQFTTIQVSQAVINDFPDLQLSAGLEIIAGLLYVPLSSGGKDFIAFLRKGQPRDVHWAGKPFKDGMGTQGRLEPRKSFKIWSETVAGRCRLWTDEQLETAGVLALVYGKFIEVWRQKENALQTTKLTNLLLSNASHEVRTPLNHIINYLEMALNGPLDFETRDNLSRSHAASKSLLFTINDLLDLTRLESGNETSFNEPFDLQFTIEEATHLYNHEAERRNITFQVDVSESPKIVVGDAKKIRTVVQNLTANSLKYTSNGCITISCTTYGEPEGLRGPKQIAVEIVVTDTGCGIPPDKLESIFREFEQVESSEPKTSGAAGVGLGLAVVARIVEQLGGQLRVDSKVDEGSRFSFLIPLALSIESGSETSPTPPSSNQSSGGSFRLQSRATSIRSGGIEIDSLVEALASNHMGSGGVSKTSSPQSEVSKVLEVPSRPASPIRPAPGIFGVTGSRTPVRPVKIDEFEMDAAMTRPQPNCSSESMITGPSSAPLPQTARIPMLARGAVPPGRTASTQLRVLIVEDNDINRTILAKRLRLDGHTVVNTTNGQEGLDKVESDREFDCVLMDIQMPILNGFEATQRIRDLEKPFSAAGDSIAHPGRRLSHRLNGRIPIFAVSASLLEQQRDELANYGIDGWILKPIDFKRLNNILKGVTDPSQRERDVYRPGCNWEVGGWLGERQSEHLEADDRNERGEELSRKQ